MERAAILQLRKDIYNNLFPDLTELQPSFWGRVVRGDTIECCISSIGIGTMRIVDREEDLLDGDAIYIAGRNLDYIAGRNIPVVFGMKTSYIDVETLIDNNLQLLDTLLYDLTARQSDVLYYKLMRYTEIEIARKLGISQAAVNLRARNAGWQQIKATLKVLENINYGEYVD